MPKTRPSILKRQKERARQEKKQRKQEKREERKRDRDETETPEATDPNYDPDIAGIVPGPQPLPTEDAFWEQDQEDDVEEDEGVTLSAGQRKHLRGRAHGLEPVVHVGQAGVTDAVVRSVDEALFAHELIKVRLHEPEDKKGAAGMLAERADAELCGLVGHTVILYRPHPDEPKIEVGAA